MAETKRQPRESIARWCGFLARHYPALPTAPAVAILRRANSNDTFGVGVEDPFAVGLFSPAQTPHFNTFNVCDFVQKLEGDLFR
jgi:hypothetical protein